MEIKNKSGTQQALNKCPFHPHVYVPHSLDQLVLTNYVLNIFLPLISLEVPLPRHPHSVSLQPARASSTGLFLWEGAFKEF